MPIEHLLVVAPVKSPVQPVREGWTPYGAVEVSSLPEVSCVWVYGRRSNRQPRPVTRDEAARQRALFQATWAPASEEALMADLFAVFDPCTLDGAEA